MTRPFSTTELRQLKDELTGIKTAFSSRRNPIVMRAVAGGMIQSDTLNLTLTGQAHLNRLKELDTAIELPNLPVHKSQLAVFRTTDYPSALAASAEGALYSLPLPDSGVLPRYRLVELNEVVRMVGDSMAHDRDLLQINRNDGGLWTDMTQALTRDILDELQKDTGPQGIQDHAEHLHHVSNLVLLRAHDYEPTALGMAKAASDGALRALPISVGPLQGAHCSPSVITWLNTLESTAKAAARCIDANADMQVAIALTSHFGLADQYMTLNEFKEAYCHHPHCDSVTDIINAEMKHISNTIILQQDPDADSVTSFVLKAISAVEAYAIFSEHPDKALWKEYLSALMPHTPDGLTFQSLSESIPFESFKALCTYISDSPDSPMAVESLEMLSALMLRNATQVIENKLSSTPRITQPILDLTTAAPTNSPNSPSMRR